MIHLVPVPQSPRYISEPKHGGDQTDVYGSAQNVTSHAMGLYGTCSRLVCVCAYILEGRGIGNAMIMKNHLRFASPYISA